MNLDQVERNLARMGQEVVGAGRDIGRYVFVEDELLVAARYLGGAVDDDPVLSPMVALAVVTALIETHGAWRT